MAILECGGSLVCRTFAHQSRIGPIAVCVVPAVRFKVGTFVVRIAAIECDATLGPTFASTIDAWCCLCAVGVSTRWARVVVCRKVATFAAKRDLEPIAHGDDWITSIFGRAMGWRDGDMWEVCRGGVMFECEPQHSLRRRGVGSLSAAIVSPYVCEP